MDEEELFKFDPAK
jgi:hypothetical protein